MSILSPNAIRNIENIKVYIRERKALNVIARFFYFPFWAARKIRIYYVARGDCRIAINNIREVKKGNNFLIYLGIPIDKNLGDTAQYICIRKWFQMYYPELKVVEIKTSAFRNKRVRRFLRKKTELETMFFVQSGETFDNRHPDHMMHRILFEEYPKNPIVFFPQTIFFTDEAERNQTKKLMEEIEKIILLTRDEVSFNIAEQFLNVKNLYLYPDIVTSLIGQNYAMSQERNGILVCKRVDGEKKIYDRDLQEYLNLLSKEYGVLDVTDTDFYCSYKKTYEKPEIYVKRKIEQFAKYNLIITDRYHGMIFSLIANTPCIVLETHGHKVVAGEKMFESYFGRNAITLISNISEIPKEAKRMYGLSINNDSVLKQEYFDTLKETINRDLFR